MKTVVGVFTSRSTAEQLHQRLRAEGIGTEDISVLTPAASEKELAEVPTMATEQPGMGTAVGSVVGAAIGGSGGAFLGTLAPVLLPGVGPVLVGGMIAAGLLGGAAAGAAAGGALEDAQTKGLPIDELFLYEDALRQGRTVVLAQTEEGEPEDRVRSIFEQAGAESIDAARERWWLGLRDVEQEHYTAAGGDFRAAEIAYRRGFEAALHPAARAASHMPKPRISCARAIPNRGARKRSATVMSAARVTTGSTASGLLKRRELLSCSPLPAAARGCLASRHPFDFTSYPLPKRND